MKYFIRFFRSARNRRRNSRIPGLFESMKSFNAKGDGKIPWKISPMITRPILAPCFVRSARID
jgi:hypothetical protein